MRALIVGISGQDGAYLAEHLLGQGYEVWGASRDAEGARFDRLEKLGVLSRVRLVSASLGDFRSVLSALAAAQPDEVYNLAGQSSVSLSFDQPVETFESVSTGTLNLLEAIRFFGKGIKLYNAGSSECFGESPAAGADEGTPFHPAAPMPSPSPRPSGWCAITGKPMACSPAMASCSTMSRPCAAGASSPARWSQPLPGSSRATPSASSWAIWTYAATGAGRREYVRAMALMLKQAKPDDFVIATGESHSLKEFVACAFEAAGLNWQQHVDHDPGLLRPTDIMASHANPAKASRILNWRAEAKMKEVVRRMLEAELGAG